MSQMLLRRGLRPLMAGRGCFAFCDIGPGKREMGDWGGGERCWHTLTHRHTDAVRHTQHLGRQAKAVLPAVQRAVRLAPPRSRRRPVGRLVPRPLTRGAAREVDLAGGQGSLLGERAGGEREPSKRDTKKSKNKICQFESKDSKESR